MTDSRARLRRSCWLAVPLFAACIDVGHDAEVGCLVDRTEPGCRASGGTSGGRTNTGGSTGAGKSGSGGTQAGGAGDGGHADAGASGDTSTSSGSGGATS
jgi:hypothetical protein